jgi:hypothetical protein
MVDKKGQITLFIVIGIVIVVSLSVLFYANSSMDRLDTESVSEVPSDILPVKSFVESCIELVGKEAILWIGQHGGYFELPEESIDELSIKTAYYFYEGNNYKPSKLTIEQELSEYLDSELLNCVGDFSEFSEQGFEINQGTLITSTIIRPNNVLFEVDFPIEINKDSSQFSLLTFTKSIEIGLYKIHQAAEEIISEQMAYKSSVCLSCLLNTRKKYDILIDMVELRNDSILFIIKDEEYKINDLLYEFKFANKYERFSCDDFQIGLSDIELQQFSIDCVDKMMSDINEKLIIEKIPEMNILPGSQLFYDVNASGTGVSFSDYSTLFTIDKETGIINFIPSANEIGNYTIWIEASDSIGNEEFESFQLNVMNST